MVSQPTDLIPQGWIPDPTAALVWWLANPLLRHFCPKAMAEAAARLPEMDAKEKQRVLWAIRGRRGKLRASQTIPADLPTIPREDLEVLYLQVETAVERSDCRRFGNTLHPCEFDWFAEQLRAGLAARATEPIKTPAANG